MTTLCADVIATFNQRIVVIRRLTAPVGLALPAGKKESHETLRMCAIREFTEETGLTLSITMTLGLYDHPYRDSRDHASQLFAGVAHGVPQSEKDKTEILFLSKHDIVLEKENFVLDHYAMILSYLDKR